MNTWHIHADSSGRYRAMFGTWNRDNESQHVIEDINSYQEAGRIASELNAILDIMQS